MVLHRPFPILSHIYKNTTQLLICIGKMRRREKLPSVSSYKRNHWPLKCESKKEQFAIRNVTTVLYCLVLVVSTNREVLSQSDLQRLTFVPTSTNCSNLSVVHFLSFVPCRQVLSSEDVELCDIFVRVAMEMAVERINQNSAILPNTELRLALVSDLVETGSELNQRINPLIEALLVLVKDKQVKTTLWGAIGPTTHTQAAFISDSIFSIENAGVMMVSYSLRDATLNHPEDYQSTFYRSLPSDNTISAAMVALTKQFQWTRIGLLHSKNPSYTQMSQNFRASFLNSFDDGRMAAKLLRTVSFSDMDDFDFLENLRLRDIRIIVGFFRSLEARTILCAAKNHSLTTANHVWMLPAYYNPDWWKLSSSGSKSKAQNPGCTDNEILDILDKTVIFIDGVKYPSMDMTMAEFNSELVNKTKQLFPSLRDVDLSQYLQHSRATSAYDAVMLVAQSLNLVVDRGGDLCHVPLRIQTALEKCFMNCEQCRLFYSNSSMVMSNNSECEYCANEVACDLNNSTFQDLRRPQTLDQYGQVLISQFINGINCPISLYWPRCDLSEGEIIQISKLHEHPCAGKRGVELDRSTIFPGVQQCPSNFQWKGGRPPRSNDKPYSFIPLSQFIPVAVLTVLGMLVGIILVTLHIIWRNKKYIKASSPRLNIIFIIGYLLLLPSMAIFDTLVLSAGAYNIAEHFRTPLCQLEVWFFHIGSTLMLAVFIVKNWRIHRIFHNKHLKEIEKWQLSDGVLMLLILLILLPALVLMSLMTGLSPYEFQELELKDRFQVIFLTYCGSNDAINDTIWVNVFLCYKLFLAAILFALALSASKVPKVFATDGRTSQRMVLLLALVITLFLIVDLSLRLNPFKWYIAWWISILWAPVFPIVIMLWLLLPQVYLVVIDARHKKKERKEESVNTEISKRYSMLLEESIVLKSYLAEMDKELCQFKKE